MKHIYKIDSHPVANDSNVIQRDNVRLTILTPMLVRIEWSDSKSFIDNATQKVWFRNFNKVSFFSQNTEDGFYLETESLTINYVKADNLRDSILVNFKNPCAAWNVISGRADRWRYGDQIKTLPGTARTLDNTNGNVELENSIISRNGFAVLDDSSSCLVLEDGKIVPRNEKNDIDIYLFAYGHDYKKCLADFFKLTGKTPIIPRWALGNWWSRYHKYTQKEYLDLMQEFKKNGIPISVAMIDMDWHITQIDSSIGSGWTGYSWNKEYFPNPKEFLAELHKNNIKTSLNVHPAEGVGRHETEYNSFAKAIGAEPDGKTIPFDFTNEKYIEAYFEKLHHPLEKQGVDFWWIDWQQGTETSMKNLDPLWLLNHYHYLDNSKNNKSPLILSRYAGPGSHRYPVGFSGDTVISWESLKFQPYFTASASNIGYGWWSHDIGGHMLGGYDEELQVRWVQFGVFSPIMRLHSSASRFNHKEPWKYEETAYEAIKKYMRLRQKMIPYTYTMNERFSRTGEPLIEPMYYSWPEENDAYYVPNEYMFGSELICAPVTSPRIKELNLSCVRVWLPQGLYTDIFTGVTYTGGKVRNMYRPLKDIPVFLKPAGIFVMEDESEIDVKNKSLKKLEIYTANNCESKITNSFTLYEDDGEGVNSKSAKNVNTLFTMTTSKKAEFKISAAEGDLSLIPSERTYKINFLNSNTPKKVVYKSGGEEKELQYSYDELKRTVTVEFSASVKEDTVIIVDCEKQYNSVAVERCANLLDKANIEFVKKDIIYDIIKSRIDNPVSIIQELMLRGENTQLCEALLELIESR